MGNTDSKLQFKTHIFRLFETTNIPRDDASYWVKFWTQPDSVYDVFTLLSSSDIRKTRDGNLENLETLVLVIFARLKELKCHKMFPHNEVAPARELLNCVRILTRILPFIYEKGEIRQWENDLFWHGSDPIGPQLIDITLDLLFTDAFTVKQNGAIWEPGIGSNTSYSISHDIVSNRVEILRLLLTLVSNCLYETLPDIAVTGSEYLSYIVSKPDKRLTMTILCSLLNTSLNYSPGGKVPYDHMIIADRNRQLVIYSVQLLTVLLIYPVPEAGGVNTYHYFLSKIRHEKDFQFIIDNLLRFISQPILASSSLLPGSHSEIYWISELLTLFWELIQCNKKFRDYLLLSSSCTDFIIFLLAYIEEKYHDKSKRELVRLCSYILLYLSSDHEFIRILQHKVDVGDGENLRKRYITAKSKLSIFNSTYGDYLINQLLLPLINNNDNLFDILSPTFVEIIYNISPYVLNISYSTSANLIQLFTNLLADTTNSGPTKEYLIICLLKIFSNLIHYNFRSNSNLLFVILKNESKFRHLHNQSVNPQRDEPEPPRSIKGKQPSSSPTPTPPPPPPPSQQQVWSLIDPIISIIQNLQKLIPYAQHITNPQSTKMQPHIIIDSIRNIKSLPNVDLDPHEPGAHTFTPIKFVWNSNSLGWYQSIIWGSIFQNETQAFSSSGTIGIWNNTNIKLFRLQETARLGPSLLRPRGAVDAVAESVIQQFGKLTTNR